MNVLVTGSTGFIGSHLCQALLTEGFRVRAFHRPSSPLTLLNGLQVEHVHGDLAQPETLQEAMKGVEVVFHAAAYLNKLAVLSEMLSVTVQGTRNVMEAATQAGVRRLVHTSSVAALGVPRHVPDSPSSPIDETQAWNYPAQWWPYGYAKYLAELEVQRAVAQGLDAVIVNPAVVIGAGDLNRVSGEVIVQMAHHQLPFAPPGGLNVVHIADVTRGHLAAMEHGRTGQRYILGGDNLTHLKFLQFIAGVVNRHPPQIVVPAILFRLLALPLSALARLIHIPVRTHTLRQAGTYFYYDLRKAQQELGLVTTHSTRQAIQEAYDWYCQQGMINSHT